MRPIPRLSSAAIEQPCRWVDDHLENPLVLPDGVKAPLDQSRREIAGGQFTARQP